MDPDPAVDLNDQDVNPALSLILIQLPAGVTINTIQHCYGSVSVLEMDSDPGLDLEKDPDLGPAMKLVLILMRIKGNLDQDHFKA